MHRSLPRTPGLRADLRRHPAHSSPRPVRASRAAAPGWGPRHGGGPGTSLRGRGCPPGQRARGPRRPGRRRVKRPSGSPSRTCERLVKKPSRRGVAPPGRLWHASRPPPAPLRTKSLERQETGTPKGA
ncbi:hypothetical protein C0Q64_05005 [Streptomyces albidoflavus]|nr:hypothetical protein C0Q64_05005 [Streptomyces albidoflavus]